MIVVLKSEAVVNMYDFHIHTNFSSDSKVAMESMVMAGIDKGLKELCFTDHVEFGSIPPFEKKAFDVGVYACEIERLREKYGKQISIKMGAEIGYQTHVVDKMSAFTRSADFDFILCSLHAVDEVKVHNKALLKGRTTEAVFAKYFEAYYDCVKDDVIFNVLGHFDLLKRYTPYKGEKVFKDNFDVIEATFKHLIENGKGIEVNTSGFRFKLGHTLPTTDFLKLYKNLGGEIITIGSDAHSPGYVADKFDYTYDLLKSVGFDYITRFEKMKPKFIKISL